MAAWTTFRLVLDVLVTSEDDDELPNLDMMQGTMQDSLAEMSGIIGNQLPIDVEVKLNIKGIQQLVPPDAPPYDPSAPANR